MDNLAVRVSVNTIAVNVALSVFKLFAGVSSNSGAMLSDAVHSISDVFSTVVVIIGVRVSGRCADEKHQYGHERFESIAAVLLAVMLGAVGIGIGYGGLRRIFVTEAADRTVPGKLALAAAIFSILVKEGMYWYTRGASKKINSGALMADAWHHRSDAFSSVGSFMGILGARSGYPVLDPAAGVAICCFILKAAVEIFVDAVRKMTDEACDDETIKRIEALIIGQNGVMGIDSLQTRRFGERVYVDVEISADGNSTLSESHGIAERVHDEIEAAFPAVKHCMVHVNPAKNDIIS
ncbi:MAG: cation diffusion facilitator family transporter [Synergistaceae bacterium]|nr:cation diffusion facilitator family transporter [Synergistaceae bacterium]